MKIYPGGDAYFGALLNSFIHVMMYSYYALALMKISCPWKRYLTQAQLLQFTSVVIFSIVAILIPSNEKTWESYTAHTVQVFEMVSLFVLFMAFYRKTYSAKKKAQKEEKEHISLAATKKEDSDSVDTEQESLTSASVTSDSSDEEQEDSKSK